MVCNVGTVFVQRSVSCVDLWLKSLLAFHRQRVRIVDHKHCDTSVIFCQSSDLVFLMRITLYKHLTWFRINISKRFPLELKQLYSKSSNEIRLMNLIYTIIKILCCILFALARFTSDYLTKIFVNKIAQKYGRYFKTNKRLPIFGI